MGKYYNIENKNIYHLLIWIEVTLTDIINWWINRPSTAWKWCVIVFSHQRAPLEFCAFKSQSTYSTSKKKEIFIIIFIIEKIETIVFKNFTYFSMSSGDFNLNFIMEHLTVYDFFNILALSVWSVNSNSKKKTKISFSRISQIFRCHHVIFTLNFIMKHRTVHAFFNILVLSGFSVSLKPLKRHLQLRFFRW